MLFRSAIASVHDCLTSAGAESNAEEETLLLGPLLEQPKRVRAAKKSGSEISRELLPAISAANFLRIIFGYWSRELIQGGLAVQLTPVCGWLSLFQRLRHRKSFGFLTSFRLGVSTCPSQKHKSVR